MTPERQRWWDSLPKEERLVRLAIKKKSNTFLCTKAKLRLRLIFGIL